MLAEVDTTNGELTDKQQRFVREYTLDHNSAAAARRAGYSEATAKVQGSRLLGRDDVRAAIAEREANIADELGLIKQWIMDRLAELARSSDERVATRAVDMLMKYRGMYLEQQHHQVQHLAVYTLDLGDELTPPEAGNDDD